MPLLQQQADDRKSRDNGFAVYDEQYLALQHSLGFQNYRNQAAGVWSLNGNGFTDPLAPVKGLDKHRCAIDGSDSHSDGTIGSDQHMGSTSPTTDNSNSPNFNANGPPQHMNSFEKGISDISLKGRLGADTTIPRPSNSVSNMQEPKSPFSNSFAEGSGLSDQGHTLHKGVQGSQGCETPPKKWLPGLEHKSPVADTSPPKDLYVPGGFGQHRRLNSRVSSLPGLPSPLGPQRYVNHLSTDTSGLVSPLPFPAKENSRYGRRAEKRVDLDLHVLKVSANAVGSPYHRFKSFGFDHERNITDPFVDNAGTGNKSPMPSPFGVYAAEDMELPPIPQIQVPTTPAFQFPGPASAKLGQNSTGTANFQGFASPSARRDFRVPKTPIFQPFPVTTPTSPSSKAFTNGTASRVDIPIPPPILSSVQGKLNHTPETRRRLDAQASVRADWIRTEAAKIAELCRQTYAAGEKFKKSGTTEDYQMWQSLTAEYNDATNQDKRQEERRNMFMPQDMKAIRTGAENVVGDQSASFGQGEVQGEGKLLGHQMAFMERVCAEIKRKKDEKEAQEGEEEITPEMLATLEKDEKKVLRQYLVNRLQNAAGEHRT